MGALAGSSIVYLIAQYSHGLGCSFIAQHHAEELEEIKRVIGAIDASSMRTKKSEEKARKNQLLFSPKKINTSFGKEFGVLGWATVRIPVVTNVPEEGGQHKGYREIDRVKNGLGIEVQLGKYPYMAYDTFAKMTIFYNLGIIDSGIEIVPMRALARNMSTGVSHFEQIKIDCEYRGVSNIDPPILILGIDVVARPNSPGGQV